MATNAIKKRLSRSAAADQLSQFARELRDGRISLGRETKLLPASDQLELTAEFEVIRLKIDMKWDV
jgi:hypothetical protein